MLKRTLSLVGALLTLCVLYLVFITEDVGLLWRFHVPEVDRHLALGETRTYLAYAALGLPAAFLLHAALSGPLYARIAQGVVRAGYWAPLLCASAFACTLSQFVTQGAWYTDDEQAYLFQMQLYSQLKLTVPTIEPENFFHHPFVLVTREIDGVRQWAGIYPFMQPGMMALSRLMGSPLISQWLCAGLISWHTGRLAERLTGRRELGLLAAWLVALSPGLIGLAATYHTAVLGCLLSLVSLRVLLWTRDDPSLVRGALLGLCAGATFLTRGLEGSLIVLVCGIACATQLFRFDEQPVRLDPRAGRFTWALAGYSLSGLLALSAYLAVNRATTGEWMRHTYTVWAEQYGGVMGFGTAMMWGRTHTPEMGIAQTVTSLARMNIWLFGWPVSLALPLLSLLKPFRERTILLLLALSAAQLTGYVFLPFGSVHDFGSAYHVWHVPWIACVAVLLAKNAHALVPSTARFYVALSAVGFLGFWPLQMEKWRSQSNDILAPVRAVAAASSPGQKSVVLYNPAYSRPGRSTWVNCPPAPAPENDALWMIDGPSADAIARRVLPERRLLRFSWENDVPTVRPVP
jgi:hypothetical protein